MKNAHEFDHTTVQQFLVKKSFSRLQLKESGEEAHKENTGLNNIRKWSKL